MLAGEIDFVFEPGVPTIQARLGGADTLILFTQTSGFTFSVVARPPIHQPGDLRGKRVGISRFGSPIDFVAARVASLATGV